MTTTKERMTLSSSIVISAIVGVLASKYLNTNDLESTILLVISLLVYAFLMTAFTEWLFGKVFKS